MNIVTRKPRPTYCEGAEIVIVKRTHSLHPYVVCTITPQSLKYNEWLHGHYFASLTEAVLFFCEYPNNRQQVR